MHDDLRQRVTELLETPEAKATKTLVAFSIRKSKTVKDDEILDNIDEVADLISANIKEVADQNPTDKEAKDAAMVLLKSVSKATSNKWDDAAVAVLDKFI